MSADLQAPQRRRSPVTSYHTTAYLRRRAHTLRIPDSLFGACMTIGALQVHVRTQYNHLAHRYHPDRAPYVKGIGYTFRRMAEAYHFLMGLPPAEPLHRLPEESETWREYRRLCAPLGYAMAWGETKDVREGWQIW